MRCTLSWLGRAHAPSSTLLSDLGYSVDLGIYLPCPLKVRVRRQVSRLCSRAKFPPFISLGTFHLFFTFYWFLLGFWFCFFAHPFLWYLTLAIPIVNLLTLFMQPLPHFLALPISPSLLGRGSILAVLSSPLTVSQPGVISPSFCRISRSNIAHILKNKKLKTALLV